MKEGSILNHWMSLGLVSCLAVSFLAGCGQDRQEAKDKFFEAVKAGDLKTATSLVEKFPELLQATDNDLQASHWAAQYNHADVLRMLLDKGADINAETRDGESLAEYAIGGDPAKVPVMKVLIEKGIDVNQLNSEGRSLLMMATRFWNEPLVKLLIESGADVNAKSKKGNTALHHAVISNNPKMVALLLEKGADPGAKNLAGRTPLQEAMGEEEAQILEDPNNPGRMISTQVWVEGKGVEKRAAVIEILKKRGQQK